MKLTLQIRLIEIFEASAMSLYLTKSSAKYFEKDIVLFYLCYYAKQ